MKVVAFLPAKSHSERITNKNVELLDGRPLFLHNLEKLCALDCIDKVYLDTESEEIFRLADHLPIEWMKRDPKFATNATDGHELFMYSFWRPAHSSSQKPSREPLRSSRTTQNTTAQSRFSRRPVIPGRMDSRATELGESRTRLTSLRRSRRRWRFTSSRGRRR
jgi:CMP-N-acetylneuraminic acid synthetase